MALFRLGPERAEEHTSFSAASLRVVNNTLNKHATVDASNEEALVDAFRSLAQHLTWADQHDAQLFDLFVELRMVAHFSRVLAQCALPSGSGTAHTAVAVQLLQTLSILVLNTSRVTSMYYLCSNNYLEDVLTCADKQLHAAGDSEPGGSELLAWYVSFLKALSLRLDKHTIQFFVTDAQPPSCRLYAHVLRYITHGDALVRAAARAAVLNVLKVNDGRVLQAALGDDSLRAALCTTLAYDVATCTSRVGAALVAPPAAGDVPLSALPPPWSDVAHACEELDDGLCYLNDLLNIGVPAVADAVTEALFDVALPPLLGPLLPAGQLRIDDVTAENEKGSTSTTKLGVGAALFGLSRLLRVVSHPGVTATVLASLGVGEHGGEDGESSTQQRGEAQRRRTLLVATLAGPGGGDFGASAAAVFLLASACDVEAGTQGDGATTSALLHDAADGCACADLIAGLLSFLDFACVLTTRQGTPPADVAAVLPVAACAGWTLRQLLVANESARMADTHVAAWRASADGVLTRLLDGPWADAVMPLTLDTWRALSPRLLAPPALSDVAVAGALVRCARIRGSSSDIPDALADTPPASHPPAAEHGPSSGDADTCLHAIRSWVVWHALGLVLTQHSPPGELLATALPVSPPSSPRAATQVPPDALPSEFCDGFTLPDAEPGAPSSGVFTCRVSFERGREKRLQLWCAPCAVHAVAGQSGPAAVTAGEGQSTRTGMLLLTETVPIGMSHARIVRSVAPVLGSQAYIDPAHAKWLHIRVRPCVGALRMCLPGNGGTSQATRHSSAGPFAGGGTQLPGQWHEPQPAVREQKRMQDGHWTLAFDTKETCADALAMIQREAASLRAECGEALELLVQHMAVLSTSVREAEVPNDFGLAARSASDDEGDGAARA